MRFNNMPAEQLKAYEDEGNDLMNFIQKTQKEQGKERKKAKKNLQEELQRKKKEAEDLERI